MAAPELSKFQISRLLGQDNWLFAVGQPGVVRISPDLPAATSPEVFWDAEGTPMQDRVELASASRQTVRIMAAPGNVPLMEPTRYRVTWEGEPGQEIEAGVPLRIPVGWGKTPVTLTASQYGLTSTTTTTIIRPYPIWLRPWMVPIYLGLLGGMVWQLSRWKARKLEARNAELERHVEERTIELRKANAAKEEFLAGVSHEIRNPLNGVVGICAMLGETKTSPQEQMLVRTLAGCSDQLRSMLDDILDFSRIERGQISLSEGVFDMRALLEEAARIMDPEGRSTVLNLPENPVWLRGDSGKLRQIVSNLVTNALKYGVPREAGIDLAVSATKPGHSRVRLVVRNTGPTLPKSELDMLFESFQRGSQSHRSAGSGLGLSVCRKLINAMGGHISAASEAGVTEFAVDVVLPDAQAPAIDVLLPNIVSRVLAVEDEHYNRIALGHLLRGMGYQVDWAHDATTAIRLAQRLPDGYDLVITDWRLPDLTGAELCRRLLTIFPSPRPPIVALTAYSTGEKIEEAREAGMSDFLTKPVTREKLTQLINRLAAGMQPKRSLDTFARTVTASPFAGLTDLAPSVVQIADEISTQWARTMTLAGLRDPRTGRECHAIRSKLLMVGEDVAAEQVGLLEGYADDGDWGTFAELFDYAAEEVTLALKRLDG